MVNLSLTVVPGKALKGGKHKVRISVAHNGQTRYILTDVILDSAKEWKNGQVVRRGDATYLNIKLLKRLQEVQRIIDEIPYVEGLTAAEVVETVTNTKKRRSHTMQSAFDEMMEVSDTKDGSKDVYQQCFRSITKVIPASTPVTRLTPLAVQRYVKASGNLAPITLQIRLRFLGKLLRFCQRNGYTEFRTLPTDGSAKPVIAVRQNWLTPDEVRKVRDTECRLKTHRRFRDIFMLSYYLGGINIVDLAKINFDECAHTLKYIRTKTERTQKVNPYVEFDIPDEAKPIIERYKGKNGRLRLSKRSPEDCSADFSKPGREFRQRYGLPPTMTFYSARKSFAQHAFQLGISESVVDYVLGHSLGGRGNKMLYAYIKVTPRMATDCVRKVCDFLASDGNFS